MAFEFAHAVPDRAQQSVPERQKQYQPATGRDRADDQARPQAGDRVQVLLATTGDLQIRKFAIVVEHGLEQRWRLGLEQAVEARRIAMLG